MVNALISADKAGIALTYKQATAIDLAGRDVFEAVQVSVNPKVITTPKVAAMAKDGIQLLALARVTVRANINRLVGGAGEETILARVGEGIVSTIGSADSHKAVLENPDLISKTVLAKGLDAGTAFEILSIDIADVDVGKNIGAELQTDQAEADKRIAQAKAEERRALAVAMEQEFKAEAQNQRAKVIAAEAQIPLAIAEAFRSGNLGVMDYQRYRNVQADTTHAARRSRAERQRADRPGAERWTSGPLLVLGLMWVVLNALRKAGAAADARARRSAAASTPSSRRTRARPGAAGATAAVEPAARRRDAARGRPPGAAPPRARADARQARGRPVARPPDRRLPSAEEVEEREVARGRRPRWKAWRASPPGRARRWWIRTTRPSGWSRAALAAAEAQRAPRSARRTTGRSTSGSGRSPPTRRPRERYTARAAAATRWSGGRSWDRRCRCGRRTRSGARAPRAASTALRTSCAYIRHRLLDRLARGRGAFESARLRARALQVLVHLKEVLDLLEVVLAGCRPGRSARRSTGSPMGTASTFSSADAAVHQVEQPDRTRVHEAAGEHRDRHQHQDVERIAVVAQGAGQEPVVAGIVDRAVEHAVEPEDAELLVELVLVALVGGDLDDRGDLGRRVGAGRDVVPGMEAALRGRWARRSGSSAAEVTSGSRGATGDRAAQGSRRRDAAAALAIRALRRRRYRRPEWRNGRRSGLKIHRGQPRASSTLASGIARPLQDLGVPT